MNLTLLKKMISGYIVIILVPVLIIGFLFLQQSQKNLIREYQSNRQSLLEQSHSNYKTRIMQMQSNHQLFQNSRPLIQYLQGYNKTASDEIYCYLTSIRPLFSYVHANMSNMSVIIYHTRNLLVPLKNDVLPLDASTPSETELETDNGKWRFDSDLSRLYYTEKLFSPSYYRTAGYMRIWVENIDVLGSFLVSNEDEVALYLDNTWFSLGKKSLSPISTDDSHSPAALDKMRFQSGVYNDNIVNFTYLSELNAYIATITPVSSAGSTTNNMTILLLLLLILLILSLMYYMIVNSLSRRLINLSWHIRKTDFDHIIQHDDMGYSDEIGDVIRAFNKMIIHIRELVSDLNIAELKKKEADFYALQAQIKPHFIYNALETIRMTAESNDDGEVADLTYSLGRFIRYNMTVGSNDSSLKREIENVENYLQIYKVSLGCRLNYFFDIQCDSSLIQCPAFILQPLVENCLHHGLSNSREPLIITVAARGEDEKITVTITDNGLGIPTTRLYLIGEILAGRADPSQLSLTGNGIGIVNINKRLGAYFDGAAEFTITAGSPVGTVCTIRFPK